jgi:hypothetical protein
MAAPGCVDGEERLMSSKQALLDCTFGWGKTCHLYTDSIEVAGKSYNLEDLTAIRPTYRTVLGVPSARLELYFGLQRLVLRGIPDQETARLMVAHLQPYCAAEPHALRARSRTGKARRVAREQARRWERSTKLPAIPASPAESASADDASESLTLSTRSEVMPSALPCDDFAPASPESETSGAESSLADNAQQKSAVPLPGKDDGWRLADSCPLHTPRFQPPLHSIHLVPPSQKLQDIHSLPVPAVKSSVLPVIHVPVRLQPGECAHYSIGASLCSDRLSGSDRAPYPPLDHGLLILTNRRIFYIGKRSQLVLAYTHLWYVSLLHNAIALHIEQQFRRIIIELEHPQEWASRIEQLSFIARRARPRPELPTLLMAALPGISSPSRDAATLKRPAVKALAPKAPQESAAGASLSPGRIEPGIVEAQTIELAGPDCSELQTQDFPLLPERVTRVGPAEVVDAEPEKQAALADARTQDLPRTEELAEAATQEFEPRAELGDIATQELRPLAAAREEAAPARGKDAEVTTSKLRDPAHPSPWDEEDCEEIDTLPLHEKTTDELEDEEAQTISLRKRRPAPASFGAQDAPVSERLSDLEVTPRCLSQMREVRRPPCKG